MAVVFQILSPIELQGPPPRTRGNEGIWDTQPQSASNTHLLLQLKQLSLWPMKCGKILEDYKALCMVLLSYIIKA